MAEEAGVALGQFLLVSSDDGITWVEKPLDLSPVVLKDSQGCPNAFEGYSHGAGAEFDLDWLFSDR